MVGYQSVLKSLSPVESEFKPDVIKRVSKVKTLLQQGSESVYCEAYEQARVEFDLLLSSLGLMVEDVLTATATNEVSSCQTKHIYPFAGANPVPGLEMGECEVTVLGDK